MIESRTALRESQQASDGLPDINAITRELRESLAKTYEDWREGWFSSIFMGHEQVLEVNGEASRESVSDDEVVSATVAPCEEQRTIKIAHFHERKQDADSLHAVSDRGKHWPDPWSLGDRSQRHHRCEWCCGSSRCTGQRVSGGSGAGRFPCGHGCALPNLRELYRAMLFAA